MRPISLKIEGFTSFKKETDIDFSELEVFAITGDNGAGKSSILEAILFALYGKTHRLGKEKRDLVSLGLSKAAVLFEFEAGGSRYRVTRSFKQKGNPFMKLETPKDEKWTTVAEQAQVNVEVERVLRMPFDAFTKAVLIPQGHFEALLKPREPKERRKTLIDLFNLGIYDRMKTRANEIVRRAEVEESQILQQFESRYQDATPERRKEIARGKKELTTRSKELLKNKEELREQQERVQEILKWKTEHRRLQARLSEFRELLAANELKSAAAATELEEARRVEAREIPLLEVESQRLAATILRLHAYAQKESALEDLDEVLKKAGTEERNLRRKMEDLEKGMDEGVTRIRELQQRLALQGFNEEEFGLLQSVYEEVVAVRSLKKEFEVLDLKLQKEIPAVEQLAKELKTLEDWRGGMEQRLEQAKSAVEKARQDEDVMNLKLHLHVGDDCPVCGTRVQTVMKVPKARVSEVQDIREEAEKKLEALEEELKDLRSRLDKKSAERHWRERSLREDEKQSVDLAARIDSRNSELAERLQLAERDSACDVAYARFHEQKALHAGFQMLQTEIRDAEKNVAEREKQIHETSAILRIQNAEAESKQRDRDLLAAELAGLRSEIPEGIKPETSIKNLVRSLESQRKEIGERIDAIRSATRNAEVSQARIQQDEQHIRKSLKQEQGTMAELQRHLDSLTPEESAYSELFAETLRARAHTASVESSRVDHRLGEVSQQLEQMDRLLIEAKEQQDRLEVVRKDKEVYGLLFKHLAGNQLQDYIVSALLEQLVESANHSLKDLTQGRYLLDLEKDSFVVQDSWASGQSRIVETLSGGESFVVSLALALALSDFMKGGAVLESLFIDEGFGSLHRDKLDLVYEALGALSGSGKVIGLVTHIEELAARFPARLHVSNTPSGSEVHLVRMETQW